MLWCVVHNTAGVWQYSDMKDGTHTVTFSVTLPLPCSASRLLLGTLIFLIKQAPTPFPFSCGVPTGGNYVYGYTGRAGKVSSGAANATVATILLQTFSLSKCKGMA